jgi:hypothetical protein
MTDPLGFHGCVPAALLFIQATHKQVHLPMQFLIRMISFLLAMGALTDMHLWCRHSLLH